MGDPQDNPPGDRSVSASDTSRGFAAWAVERHLTWDDPDTDGGRGAAHAWLAWAADHGIAAFAPAALMLAPIRNRAADLAPRRAVDADEWHDLITSATPAARRDTYYAYLQSAAWRARRSSALERAGWACQLCSAKRHLHVHHRTYARVGAEAPDDLTVLCSPCHARFHGVLIEAAS